MLTSFIVRAMITLMVAVNVGQLYHTALLNIPEDRHLQLLHSLVLKLLNETDSGTKTIRALDEMR
jgi:hypothetical protein